MVYKIVRTKKGLMGFAVYGKLIKGKAPVYLINEDSLTPKLGSDGKQLKMLCAPESLEVVSGHNRQFTATKLGTRGFKFNREEANMR